MPPGQRNFSLKSVRIPAKKLLASGPKSLPAGHIANFQTSPSVPISFVAAAQQSILYRVVPNEMLGRVFAIRNAVQFSAIPAGILLGGALADYVFTPLAASGGEAGRLICWLFGATGGSGMAAMFSLTGFLGGLFCAMAFRSRGVQSLRKELNPEKWNPAAGEGN